MKTNKKIIMCKIIEIHSDYIEVKYRNKILTCSASSVSDYPVDLFAYFKKGNVYKFLLTDEDVISYKAIRPKLLKNKNKPTSTVSGAKNLEKHLLDVIKKEHERMKNN